VFDVDIVLDCDIISTLAKIDKIGLLMEIFKGKRIVIPNAVYVELLEAEKMGFTFPDKVFSSKIEIITMFEKELNDFKDIAKNQNIHNGEAEGITIARNRKGVFLTNDRVAVKVCEKMDIAVIDLKDLLKMAARKKVFNETEMIEIMRDIEIKDNTVIVETEEIFQEYKP
jgi:predicted nucleic acid-binding protein